MRNRWAGLVRFSAVAALGGAFSLVVFSSNCGGSGSMSTGAAGNNGTAGTTGSAGTSGSAGTTGTGGSGTSGATGSGGTSGPNTSCSTNMDLTCGTGALTLPSGHVTDFGPTEWSGPAGQFCNADGLRGSVFSYSGGTPPVDGGPSTNGQGVDTNAGNLRLTLTAAGTMAYAGGGIAFFRCVDVSSFNALKFTAFLMSGDLSACNFVAELQTFEQRPTTQNPPGGCVVDADAGVNCYDFPSAPVTLTSSAQTFTIPFSTFTTSGTPISPAPGQVVGLQFQFTPMGNDSGADPTPCTAEIRIDDVDFVH